MFNIIMGVVLFLGPVAGFFLGGKSSQGLFIGLGLAAFVIAIFIILERIPLDLLVFGVIGAVGGLIFGKVSDWLIFRLDLPRAYQFMQQYNILINLFLAVLGAMIAIRKKSELDLLDKDIIVKGQKNQDIKILDTSVLIDGRISDIATTGFLSGRLLVPRFVLHELQMVADSSDASKRQRGRRGLDVLKKMQEEKHIQLKVYDRDYSNIQEVDTKILELAKELGAKVATTDFNLNKVAALEGVSVLNINDLAAALKPVVLPGDALNIFLVKEGKERSQAVGYLDDGTMVVVEDGRKAVGKRAGVMVSSILQTSAGRMIFARLQNGKDVVPPEKVGDTGIESQASST